MTPQPDDAGDTIDPGRRMVLSTGADASLGQRLLFHLDRLTWRTPLHDLRLKGRHPARLLAVAADPFAGDVARGEALAGGTLVHGAEARALDTLDLAAPAGSPGFAEHLHAFAWLRDLATLPDRARATAAAEALARRWLAAHGDRVTAAAWRPELWGRRVQMWAAHAPLLLSSTDLVFRARVLDTLARGSRHLDRTADRADAGAPRIAAWSGVVTAGLLLPGGDARLAIGEAGLARALAASVSSDGGIVSRSPAAQGAAIEALVLLRGAYEARRMELPQAPAEALVALVSALLGLAHGDGGLSSWQGAVPLDAETLAALVAATRVRTRPLRQARDWGYQRLAAARTVLVIDAAPPPLVSPPGGGCASTLAFELSEGEDRVVVNCGGGLAVAGTQPALAAALRTTAAHATLTLADSNSTAIHADGTLGRGVREVELSRQESDAGSRVEASHDGYARRLGFVHRRALTLTGDGRELRGDDTLLPKGRRAHRRATPFALRFHLGPGVHAAATADARGALLRMPSGALWQFRTRGDALAVEESLWVDGTGRIVATQQIVVTGTADAGGAAVGWSFRRAG